MSMANCISMDWQILYPNPKCIRVVSRIEGTLQSGCTVAIEDGDQRVPTALRIGVTGRNGEFLFYNIDPAIRYRIILRSLNENFNSVIRERVMAVNKNEL